MVPGFLVDTVLRGVLGGRRKRSRNALRYLTGRRGSLWSNPTTVLTAAGVAWGIFETLQKSGGLAGAWGGGSESTGGVAAAPAAGVASVPPLPNQAVAPVDDHTLLLVRLAISAANADGTMNDAERAAVTEQATAAGAGDIIASEMQVARPLAEIVAGVSDPAQRATLYVLAFTIVRADEQVSGAERIYLAQLAHLLDLDPATVSSLEKDTGDRIDALGDQGQPGG
jgi:uncharacterized membrane protein YebE (DUF533 family)